MNGRRVTAVFLAVGWFAVGCGGGSTAADAGSEFEADGPADASSDGEDVPDMTDFGPETTYDPYRVLPASELPVPRGGRWIRGILHAHSVYSHDACDDEPFVEGVRNEECFLQLRAAMCDTAQDFVFLSDHAHLFAEHEFPDVLLYAPGDTPIERGGLPAANRVHCDDGREVIVAAGTETGTMPLGLERHVGDTVDERFAAYEEVSAAAVERFRDAGAMAFVHHTEEWALETLTDLPLDGIEVYNLHYNLMANAGDALNLVIDLQRRPWQVPAVEIGLVGFFQENAADMERWARLSVLRPTTGILATDVHRNSFPGEAPDGERLDSYRRLMHWFSNYVLVPAGPIDDAAIKNAIRAGRLYGGFDYLGYAVGFDFHAESEGTVFEMGADVPAPGPVTLRVAMPSVYEPDPEVAPATLRARILRAEEGAWVVVSEGTTDLEVEVGPGVYRADVRIVPAHLRPLMGTRGDRYLVEYPWVYANPIRVTSAGP